MKHQTYTPGFDPKVDEDFLEWLRGFLGPPPLAETERSLPDERLMILYGDLFWAFNAGRKYGDN